VWIVAPANWWWLTSWLAFRKVRPRLEEFVINRKVARLKVERQTLLESIYQDYQKSLDPDRWQYLPPSKLVQSIEGFSKFLNAPYDKRGDMAPSYAVSLFPDFIANWTRKQQETVVSLFPSTVPDQDHQMKLEKLELATSVFTCIDCKYKVRDGRVLLGWNNICRHRRSTAGTNVYVCGVQELNELASAAAESLVRCVGLDPATTTIEQMNTRNDRFLCSNCTSEPSRGVIGLKVYNWVECVSPFVFSPLTRLNYNDCMLALARCRDATGSDAPTHAQHPRLVSPDPRGDPICQGTGIYLPSAYCEDLAL
jgi:hypothetical protein